MTPTVPKKSDSIKLEDLIKSVKSLESKITQQESNISKKLDETLQLLNNVISENNALKEKISVLEKELLILNKQTFLTKYLIEIAGSVILLFLIPRNSPLAVPLMS